MSKVVVVEGKEELNKILDEEVIGKGDKRFSLIINEDSIFISREPIDQETIQDSLFDIENIAVKTGIKDFARYHDHYIYGIPKGEA